jgi:hypothetical protein
MPSNVDLFYEEVEDEVFDECLKFEVKVKSVNVITGGEVFDKVIGFDNKDDGGGCIAVTFYNWEECEIVRKGVDGRKFDGRFVRTRSIPVEELEKGGEDGKVEEEGKPKDETEGLDDFFSSLL